jgi:hypothetical protein
LNDDGETHFGSVLEESTVKTDLEAELAIPFC